MRSPVAAKLVTFSDFYNIPSSIMKHLAIELVAFFLPTGVDQGLVQK